MERRGGEAKQACQVANERRTLTRSLARVVDLHTFDKKRREGETHLLNCSSPRGEAGGEDGEEELKLRLWAAVVKCNAADGGGGWA